MASPLDDFRDYLASRGMRLTAERGIVIAVIFGLQSPFTAEAVIEVVSRMRTTTGASRSSVYRMLQMLVEAGQITIESVSGDQIQYSHTDQTTRAVAPASELCQSAHAKLIAGKCPWCGCTILNGKPADDKG